MAEFLNTLGVIHKILCLLQKHFTAYIFLLHNLINSINFYPFLVDDDLIIEFLTTASLFCAKILVQTNIGHQNIR